MAAASDETIVVGIGLVWNGDKLAVGVRPADSPMPGFSEFPGGKCDPGELPMQAVVRECLEEMGVPIQVLGPRLQTKHHYPHGLVELHFFDCRAIGEAELKPPFEWKTVMELGALTFPEANAELLKDLAEHPKPK
jgi:8-oxo-dGTP diphosphatase